MPRGGSGRRARVGHVWRRCAGIAQARAAAAAAGAAIAVAACTWWAGEARESRTRDAAVSDVRAVVQALHTAAVRAGGSYGQVPGQAPAGTAGTPALGRLAGAAGYRGAPRAPLAAAGRHPIHWRSGARCGEAQDSCARYGLDTDRSAIVQVGDRDGPIRDPDACAAKARATLEGLVYVGVSRAAEQAVAGDPEAQARLAQPHRGRYHDDGWQLVFSRTDRGGEGPRAIPLAERASSSRIEAACAALADQRIPPGGAKVVYGLDLDQALAETGRTTQ